MSLIISIFQVFHSTIDVEIEVSKRSLLYAGDLIFFFQLEQYFAKYSRFISTIADLAMIVPLIIWNFFYFRVAEKDC